MENNIIGELHLEIKGPAISLKDPQLFESDFLEVKRVHILNEQAKVDNDGKPGFLMRNTKRTSRLAALSRVATLWTHKAPRISLAGVIVTEEILSRSNIRGDQANANGEFLVSDPIKMLDVIAEEWNYGK